MSIHAAAFGRCWLIVTGGLFCQLVLQVLDGFFELETSEAMADIYVWLRYSATRQLTWQRNYNTQPRILSAAQVTAGRQGRWAAATGLGLRNP